MNIEKRKGDSWHCSATVRHKGPARQVKVLASVQFPGLGFYADNIVTLSCGNDTVLKDYTVNFQGMFAWSYDILLDDGEIGLVSVDVWDQGMIEKLAFGTAVDRYVYRKNGGNGGSDWDGISIPTVAQVLAAESHTELINMYTIFTSAYQNGQIDYTHYLELYDAYLIRWGQTT